jgi:hypothetical protein
MGRESEDRREDRDRSILAPDDLDITRDERAAPLSDGRFIIASDADDSPSPPSGTDGPVVDDHDSTAETGPSATERVEERDLPHGFVITAKFGGPASETSVFAEDMGQVFRGLMLWYAAGVDPSTPAEKVIGVLLQAAGIGVRYPTGTLARLVTRHDLTPEDTIADLLDAVADDGVRIE